MRGRASRTCGAVVALIGLVVSSPATALHLAVPEEIQEESEWCWAAVSAAVLKYYGHDVDQCEVAELTRTTATWHDFGSVDCCVDTSQGCNYWNYNWGETGSIKDILEAWSITNRGVGGALTDGQVLGELAAHQPFIIRWEFLTGNGHFVVGAGLEDNVAGSLLHYMNPWPGEGQSTAELDWVREGTLHTWTHTNTLETFPDCLCEPEGECCDGCRPANEDAACGFGDGCILLGACTSGVCVGLEVLDCDDGDVCTTDLCDPVIGCHYSAETTCGIGDCEHTVTNCPSGSYVACDPLEGQGAEVCDGRDNDCDGVTDGIPGICDDGNICTFDRCDGVDGCEHRSGAAPCDDGDPCTVNDACDPTEVCVGEPMVCDDGNVCTEDTCVDGECQVTSDVSGPCDDGDPCTVESCLGGVCTPTGDVPGCCHRDEDCDIPAMRCDTAANACVALQCTPCVDDEDCVFPGNRCIVFPSGHWCGVECEGAASDCGPDGVCTQLAEDLWQCMPAQHDCECARQAFQACHEGSLAWFDSCWEPRSIIDNCSGRGCVDGACCPRGTRVEDGACSSDEPPPPEDTAGATDLHDGPPSASGGSGCAMGREPGGPRHSLALGLLAALALLVLRRSRRAGRASGLPAA